MFVTDILTWICIGPAIFGGGTVLRRLMIGRNSAEMRPVDGWARRQSAHG